MGLKVYIGFVSFNGQKNMGSILHITLSSFLQLVKSCGTLLLSTSQLPWIVGFCKSAW